MDNNEFNFSDDDIIIEDDNQESNTDGINGGNNGQPPKKPFRFGRTTTFIAIAVIVVLVILVAWGIGSVSGVGMADGNSPKTQDTAPETVMIHAVKDTESTSDNIVDSSYDSTSSIYSSEVNDSKDFVETESVNIESASVDEAESTVSTSSNESSDETVGIKEQETFESVSGLVEVAEPVLNPEVESTGMVLNKSIYLLGSSYLYEVEMLVLVGEDGNYADMRYYCPKNTFDALNIGDNVYVTYQTSSDGSYSISTISK